MGIMPTPATTATANPIAAPKFTWSTPGRPPRRHSRPQPRWARRFAFWCPPRRRSPSCGEKHVERPSADRLSRAAGGEMGQPDRRHPRRRHPDRGRGARRLEKGSSGTAGDPQRRRDDGAAAHGPGLLAGAVAVVLRFAHRRNGGERRAEPTGRDANLAEQCAGRGPSVRASIHRTAQPLRHDQGPDRRVRHRGRSHRRRRRNRRTDQHVRSREHGRHRQVRDLV